MILKNFNEVARQYPADSCKLASPVRAVTAGFRIVKNDRLGVVLDQFSSASLPARIVDVNPAHAQGPELAEHEILNTVSN
jgi:hypothetical protein